jgi:hypothetical protein
VFLRQSKQVSQKQLAELQLWLTLLALLSL